MIDGVAADPEEGVEDLPVGVSMDRVYGVGECRSGEVVILEWDFVEIENWTSWYV